MRSVVAFSVVVLGCAGGGGGDGVDGGNGSGDGDGGGGSNGFFDSSVSGGGCTTSAKLVWTLEANKRVAKFDPATGTFTTVGFLNCPGSSAFFQPFSMGLDRNAVAWVLYSDYTNAVPPQLFAVDTNTLACTATNWTTQNNLKEFGIAFSTNEVEGEEDTMFIAGGPDTDATSVTLASLSTQTIQSTVIGSMSGWAELSGNAKAELWAYIPRGSTPRLERINKATGATLQTINLATPIGSPQTWAFASWGGDFWVFLKRDSDQATIVYQVDGTTGAIKSTIDTNSVGTSRTIVGAGVSTCAPVMLL